MAEGEAVPVAVAVPVADGVGLPALDGRAFAVKAMDCPPAIVTVPEAVALVNIACRRSLPFLLAAVVSMLLLLTAPLNHCAKVAGWLWVPSVTKALAVLPSVVMPTQAFWLGTWPR